MKTLNTISFVLDGVVKKIDFSKDPRLKPTTTVLQYLRNLPNHKGVKEGCAEGDCGACTVVLGELNDNMSSNGHPSPIRYTAVDSCLIFLPMLHGKQLITVENVGTSSHLHPVQKAMIDTDGSQCGYCTPGFIMSLFSLYKNCNKPSKELINDALTGNLCRCTGYRSIVEAASISCINEGKDHFDNSELQIVTLLSAIKKENIELKAEEQHYWLPANLDETLQLRNEQPDAIIISGATDIALRVTKKNECLHKIIDLSQINELKQIKEKKDVFIIGSGTNLEKVKSLSRFNFPALYDMLSVFGSLQIRNLATLGGNLGSASPIGDAIPVLMAYNASVVLQSTHGERNIKVKDFITGYRKTQIKKNEIITDIIIPKPEKEIIIKSYKISKRKDLDISTVSLSARLKLDNETINEVMLIYGGMAAQTKIAKKTGDFLKGEKWTRENVEKAFENLDNEFNPIADARSGAEARKIMAKNLLLKLWSETHQLFLINEK